MGTSIADLTTICGEFHGPVLWGCDPECMDPGVYVVCLPYTMQQIPLDFAMLQHWVATATAMTVGSTPATPALVAQELSKWWQPDETILYIGQTSGSKSCITKRVFEYYGTPLGFSSPHAGGHWIKTLSCIRDLQVYWCPCADPKQAERDLQEMFIENRGGATADDLPFGNVEFEKDKSKKGHTLGGIKFPV